MLMLNFVKDIIRPNELRRANLVAIGLFRFLRCVDFSQEKFRILSNYDTDISRLLITECGFPIKKQLFNAYIKKHPCIVRFNDNKFITQDFEDFYHAQLFYERHTLKFILGHLSPDEVFVDVGANIGGYSIRTARMAKKVYAFEPELRNFSFLKENVRLNNLHNIDIRNVAVGGHACKARLHLSGFHGRSSIVGKGEFVEVDCVNLDSVLEGKDNIGAVKIDVEGAEALVLKGAKDTLKRTNFVIIEIRNPETHTSHLINQYLTKHGFVFVERHNSNNIFMNKQNFPNDHSVEGTLPAFR